MCSLDVEAQKLGFMRPLLCHGEVACFLKLSDLLIKLQPDLCSYGQLLSLFIKGYRWWYWKKENNKEKEKFYHYLSSVSIQGKIALFCLWLWQISVLINRLFFI